MAHSLDLKENKIIFSMYCMDDQVKHEEESTAFIQEGLTLNDAKVLRAHLNYHIKKLEGQIKTEKKEAMLKRRGKK